MRALSEIVGLENGVTYLFLSISHISHALLSTLLQSLSGCGRSVSVD